jgi:isopenicillin N synthase-like dioxygenase
MANKTLPTLSLKASGADRAFVESLSEYGFAALTDHPIDMTLVYRIYESWREFFSTEQKFDYRYHVETQDGYFGLAEAESAKGSQQQDFKEYFHYYPWGQCPTDLKQDLETYYAQAESFAKQLLTWVEAFSPPEISKGYLEPLSSMIHSSESSLLRVLHYPPLPQGVTQPRASAHEDINLLTILPASNGPGLEILAKNGSWIQIADRDDQILINTGDMLAEASGGHFPSTTHRVSIQSSDLPSESRMSLPLFLHPRQEVRLSRRYLAGEYLHERLVELGVLKS